VPANGRRCKATHAVIIFVRLAIGTTGCDGDAVATPSWGTMIAALPFCGQRRSDAIVVVVVDVDVDDVDDPGDVTVVDVEDVDVVEGADVVVVEPDVGELAPTSRPTTSAPSARGIKMKRRNFDGNDAFTWLIYSVSLDALVTIRLQKELCLTRA
jgi:hypothetical protein